MQVKISPNDKGSPVGKLADAELHFDDGPLAGLKLLGFAVWERRNGSGRNVTFPARQYSVNGERRSYALLRPLSDVKAQDHVRDLVLSAYAQVEAQAAEQAVDAAGRVGRQPVVRPPRGHDSIGSRRAFSCWRLGGSVHSSRRPLANSFRKNASFMPPSMMSHGSTRSADRSR